MTVQEAALKFDLHPETIRRLLRQGSIAGKKIASRSGRKWLISTTVKLPPRFPTELGVMSDRALKKVYASSSRLRANINRAQIREMIRRGFFVKGVWLDELDTLESVAKEIVNERDKRGRMMLGIDPEFWGRAKQIVDLGAKIPVKERRPEQQMPTKQATDAEQPRRSRRWKTA